MSVELRQRGIQLQSHIEFQKILINRIFYFKKPRGKVDWATELGGFFPYALSHKTSAR